MFNFIVFTKNSISNVSRKILTWCMIVFTVLLIGIILCPNSLLAQDSDNQTNNETSNDNSNDDANIDDANIDNANTDDESDNQTDWASDTGIDPYPTVFPEITYDDDEVKPVFAGDPSIFTPRKDPFISSMLSLLCMGLGQIYVGENVVMGTILFGTEFLYIAGSITLFFVLQSEYSTSDDPLSRWGEFSGESKWLIVTFVLSYIGVKVFNVIDAYNQAIRYNRKYFGSAYDPGYTISFSMDLNGFSFGLRF